MQSLAALIGLAIILFVSTNVDDLFVLIGFYAHSAFRPRDIVAGQCAGVAVLFIVSAAGALLSLVVPQAPLGLLGIFPMLIGIGKLLQLRQDGAPTAPTKPAAGSHGNIVSVALVAIANGGDNIGVYVPSFALRSAGQLAIIALVFVAMTVLWCMLAHRMVSHPRLGAPLRRYAHILTPIVLLALGIWILHEAGSIAWLLRSV